MVHADPQTVQHRLPAYQHPLSAHFLRGSHPHPLLLAREDTIALLAGSADRFRLLLLLAIAQ